MSYAGAVALQAALYEHLSGQPALAGVPIHDAVPHGGGRGTWILIGPEEVRDASDGSGRGARHDFTVSVMSDAAGFLAAKRVALGLSDALVTAPPALARGRLVRLDFLKAVARRLGSGDARRIDLTFRARIEE